MIEYPMSSREFVKAFYNSKHFPGNKVELEVILNKEELGSITEDNRVQALAVAQQFIQDTSRISGNNAICPRCGTGMEHVKLASINALYCPKDRVIFPVT